MLSATCNQSSSKSIEDLQEDTNIALGAMRPVNSKSFDISVKANSSNESVTSTEHTINKTKIRTKILSIGGPISSNFLEWKSSIASNLHDLAIIHKEKQGIWYAVEWTDYGWQNATTLSCYIYNSFKKLETKIGPLDDSFKFNLKKTCDLVLSLQRGLTGCQNVQLPKLFEILDQLLIKNDNRYYKDLINSNIIIEFIKRVIYNKYSLSRTETILIKFRIQKLVTDIQSESGFEINDKISNFQNEPVWKWKFDDFETCLDYIKIHMLPLFEDTSIKERLHDQLERELCRFCESCEVLCESTGRDIFLSRLCLLAQSQHKDRMQKCFKSYSIFSEFSFLIESFTDSVLKAMFSHSIFKSDDDFKTFIFEICIPIWKDMNLKHKENGSEELDKLILSNVRLLAKKSITKSSKKSETSFRNGVTSFCNEVISCSLFKEKCMKMKKQSYMPHYCFSFGIGACMLFTLYKCKYIST